MKNQSNFRRIIISALLLMAVGWGGLAYVFDSTLPTLGPRWFMFFFLVIALSGTTYPFVYLLNRRFAKRWPIDLIVFLRQATWFGVYASIIIWLQIGRVLNLNRALFLAVGFIIIEWLIRTFEQSRWKPQEPANES